MNSAIVILAAVAASASGTGAQPVEPVNPQAKTDNGSGSHAGIFAQAAPIADDTLVGIAGRENLAQLNESDQSNAVEGNSVGDNPQTGRIAISGNAFRDMDGLTILNANTGNNVAINASIQVNIALPGE